MKENHTTNFRPRPEAERLIGVQLRGLKQPARLAPSYEFSVAGDTVPSWFQSLSFIEPSRKGVCSGSTTTVRAVTRRSRSTRHLYCGPCAVTVLSQVLALTGPVKACVWNVASVGEGYFST